MARHVTTKNLRISPFLGALGVLAVQSFFAKALRLRDFAPLRYGFQFIKRLDMACHVTTNYEPAHILFLGALGVLAAQIFFCNLSVSLCLCLSALCFSALNLGELGDMAVQMLRFLTQIDALPLI